MADPEYPPDATGVPSLQFKKVGALAVSPVYYNKKETRVYEALRQVKDLLALAPRYGILAWIAPGSKTQPTQPLYLAFANDLLQAIDHDRIGQAEDAANRGLEKQGKQEDLELSDKFTKKIELQTPPVWHLSFNTSCDFLLVGSTTTLHLYSIHDLYKLGKSESWIDLEMDDIVIDCQWSATSEELGVLLQNGTFRVYTARIADRVLQCRHQWRNSNVTAIAATLYGWMIAYEEEDRARLTLVDEVSFEPLQTSVDHVPAAYVTSVSDSNNVYRISQLKLISSETVMIGQYQYQDQETGWLDPTLINVTTYNIPKNEFGPDLGDALMEEPRFRSDDNERLYNARHRLYTGAIERMRLAVLADSKASDVAVFGVDPDDEKVPALDDQWPVTRWAIGTEDTDQIVIAADEAYNETYALGLVIDTTNRLAGPEGPDPVPTVFTLVTNGRLHAYQMMVHHPKHVAALKTGLMKPAEPIDPVDVALSHWRFVSVNAEGAPDDEVKSDDGQGDSGSEDEEVVSSQGTVSVAESPRTPTAAQQRPPPTAALVDVTPPPKPKVEAAAPPAFGFNPNSGTAPPSFTASFNMPDKLPAAAPAFSFNPMAASDSSATSSATTANPFGGPSSFTFPSTTIAPAPTKATVAEPPPVARTAKKNLQFASEPAPPAASSTPPVEQPRSSAPPPSSIAQPSTMTKSILKPAPSPSPTTAVVPATPATTSRFAIDYKSAEDKPDALVPINEVPPSTIDPDGLKSSQGIGNLTQQSFLQALISVASNFKSLANLTHQSRSFVMDAQQSNTKGRDDVFSLKKLRTLTSRTRVLTQILQQVDTQSQASVTQVEELINSTKSLTKKGEQYKSILANHEDEEYLRLMENMSLDIHSSRLQQSIEKSVAQLKKETTQLEGHLQELYAQYAACAPSARGGGITRPIVPTVKSVVGVLNAHGQSIVDLEARIDELQEQVEYYQIHPPSGSRAADLDRKKRQQMVREERQRRGSMSPRERLASITSTPIRDEEESKADVMTPNSNTKQQQQQMMTPSSSNRPSAPSSALRRTPSSSTAAFRPSALSALSQSFQEKLKDGGSAPSRPGMGRGFSREQSMIAIQRGKSKQRLDQLFTQVEQPTYADQEDSKTNADGSVKNTPEAATNSRRWARTGPPTALPTIATQSGDWSSDDEDEKKDELISVKHANEKHSSSDALPLEPPAPLSLMKSKPVEAAPVKKPTAAAAAAAPTTDFSAAFSSTLPPPSTATMFSTTGSTTPAFNFSTTALPPAAATTTDKTKTAVPAAAVPAKPVSPAPSAFTFNVAPPPATATAAAPIVKAKEKKPVLPTTIETPTPAATTAPVSFASFTAPTTAAPFSFNPTPATAAPTTKPAEKSLQTADDDALPPLLPPSLPNLTFESAPVKTGKPTTTAISLAPATKEPIPTPKMAINVQPPSPVVVAQPAALAPVDKSPPLFATSAAKPPTTAIAATPINPSAASSAAAILTAAPSFTTPPKSSPKLNAISEPDEVKTAPSSPIASPSPGAVPDDEVTEAAVDLLGKLKTTLPATAALAAAPAPAGGMFGANVQPVFGSSATGTTLFGAPTTIAPTTLAPAAALFPSTAAAPASATNLFAPVTAATAPSSTNLFGPTPAVGGLFGTGPNSSSTAAAATTSAPGGLNFSSALNFGTPAAASSSAATGSNLFGPLPTTKPAPAAGGGLFAGATGPNPFSLTPAAAPFGTSSTSTINTQPGAASSTNLFATPAPAAGGSTNLFSTPATNLFSTPAPAAGNLFSTPATATPAAGSLFGSSSNNLFAPTTTSAPLTNNIFSSAGGTASATNAFNNAWGSTASSTPAAPGGPFSQPATGNPFGTASNNAFSQPAAPSANPFNANPMGASFGQSNFGATPSAMGASGALSGVAPSVAQLAFGGGLPGMGFGSSGAAFGSSNAFGSGSGAGATGAVFGGGAAAGSSGFGAIAAAAPAGGNPFGSAATSSTNPFGGSAAPVATPFGGFGGAAAATPFGGFGGAAPSAAPTNFAFNTDNFRN